MENVLFTSLPLSKESLRAIEDLGYEKPSPIQAGAIPHILEGRDVLGQSQTGTGKTAAFGLPVLDRIDAGKKTLQALIMCPTRELALQVADEMAKLMKYKKGIKIVPVYGGQPIDRQLRALRLGAHIIIGTPGRIMDHMERGTIVLEDIRMVVLDEVDKMLDMGFRDDIEDILKTTPKERQTIFFSATVPEEIKRLIKKYQKDPVNVTIEHKTLTVPSIEQVYFDVRPGMKIELLTRIIDIHHIKLGVVFCNTKRMVDELVAELQGRGYFADALHGDLKQVSRDRVMKKFRQGTIELLVATDVAARGIDVDDVEAVFNYDLPQDEEDYVHRIGRTGRAGKKGKAFSFVSGRDIYKLRDIQRFAKIIIERAPVPSLSDVVEIKAQKLLDRIVKIVEKGNLEKYKTMIDGLLTQEFGASEVAAALLKNTLERDGKDMEKKDTLSSGGSHSSGATLSEEPGMCTLMINRGKEDRITPRDIVGAIAGESGISGDVIGRIKIASMMSFVDVPEETVEEVLRTMGEARIKGRDVKIVRATAEIIASAQFGDDGDRGRSGGRRGFSGGDRRSSGRGGERREYGGRSSGGDRYGRSSGSRSSSGGRDSGRRSGGRGKQSDFLI